MRNLAALSLCSILLKKEPLLPRVSYVRAAVQDKMVTFAIITNQKMNNYGKTQKMNNYGKTD